MDRQSRPNRIAYDFDKFHHDSNRQATGALDKCCMRPNIVFIVASFGFGLVHGAINDLAYFLLNNVHAARAEFPSEVNDALVLFSVLPSKLMALIRESMDSGMSHSFLAHVARTSVSKLEVAIKCMDENDGLKDFQICMLRETGMNPHFIRLMDCMPHYERWHDFSPVVNEEQRLDGDPRISAKYWNVAEFLDSVAADESVNEGFTDCLARIEQSTVGSLIKDAFSPADMDDKEMSIFGILSAHEEIVVQVPLPLGNTPILKPSDVIPLIIRHFASNPTYQSILDYMTYDWSLIPLHTLDLILGQMSVALENWPMATRISPRFKYFDYSSNSPSTSDSWWIAFHEAMKSDDAFIESAIVATATFVKLPQNLTILKAACNTHPVKSLPDIFEALSDFRNIQIRNYLVSIEIQPEGHWRRLRLCDWRAYRPRLDELRPKIQKYFDMTHSELPSKPDDLDIFIVKAFLSEPFFRSRLNLATFTLHPFFANRKESFMKMLVDAIVEETGEDELLDRLWCLNDESVWNGTLGMDIQEFLKFPVAFDLRGSFAEVKQRMHAALVLAISAKGGADFAVLDYKGASAFPEIIPILLDIHNEIDQNRGMAYWLAVSIPIFAEPAFPSELPKSSISAVAMMCDPYVSKVAGDLVLASLLKSVFYTAIGNHGSHLALYALDFASINALVGLSRVDAEAFTYAVIRTPNFIHPLLWPDIAARVFHELNFPLENQTALENLIDFDSTLNFLRAKTDGAKVDLDKVFFSQEDSLKILKDYPDICAVCHGEFLDHEGNLVEGGPFGALHPCKHLYHRTCFKYAATNQVKVTCPICDQAVLEIQSP